MMLFYIKANVSAGGKGCSNYEWCCGAKVLYIIRAIYFIGFSMVFDKCGYGWVTNAFGEKFKCAESVDGRHSCENIRDLAGIFFGVKK